MKSLLPRFRISTGFKPCRSAKEKSRSDSVSCALLLSEGLLHEAE